MSTPAGWYPQPDGQQRYWDGELWTEHFAPGVQAETSALPLLKTKQGFVFRGRSFSRAASFGWGGLALAVLLGAMSSGFSGAAIMAGVFALVVGVIALARGRVGWARLRNRAAGGVAIGAAMVFLTVGALAAPADTSPTTESAMTSSDSPTTTDAAAEAAAQAAAAERAAADVAAAAADKAAAEASAKATADAAAAAAAKATADAVAASAKAKAAAQAKAAAAAKAAAQPSPPPPPPSAKSYDNCTDMHADYKGGVALPGAVDQRRNGGHANYTPVYSRSLYEANSGSDRDGDGIACEA